MSGGSAPSTGGPSLTASASVPLDLSTGGSIVAGLPNSPVAISDSCEYFYYIFGFILC